MTVATEFRDGTGEVLHRRIVDGLITHGFAVEPGFVTPALVRAPRREVRVRDERGEFTEAGIGRHDNLQQNEQVRRDRTFWLDGSTLAQRRLLSQLEAHFAIYPPGGFYRRHLDAFRGNNPRLVSAVVYLNPDWQSGHGRCLRLWQTPRAKTPLLDVEPRAGTLVCFLSEQIPHEVLPATVDRISIAGWFRRHEGPLSWSAPLS